MDLQIMFTASKRDKTERERERERERDVELGIKKQKKVAKKERF